MFYVKRNRFFGICSSVRVSTKITRSCPDVPCHFAIRECRLPPSTWAGRSTAGKTYVSNPQQKLCSFNCTSSMERCTLLFDLLLAPAVVVVVQAKVSMQQCCTWWTGDGKMKVGTQNTRGRLSAGEVAQNPSSHPLFVFPPRLIETMASGSCCSNSKDSMPSSSPSCGKRAFGVGTTEEGLGEVDHVKRLRVAYESFTKSHPESTSLSSGPIRLPSLLAHDDIQPLDRPTIPVRNHLGDHRLSAVDVIQEVLRGIIDSPKEIGRAHV